MGYLDNIKIESNAKKRIESVYLMSIKINGLTNVNGKEIGIIYKGGVKTKYDRKFEIVKCLQSLGVVPEVDEITYTNCYSNAYELEKSLLHLIKGYSNKSKTKEFRNKYFYANINCSYYVNNNTWGASECYFIDIDKIPLFLLTVKQFFNDYRKLYKRTTNSDKIELEQLNNW